MFESTSNIESGDLHPTTAAILFHCTPSRTNVEETHSGLIVIGPLDAGFANRVIESACP
jgi:hypothetical protein